MTRQVDVATDGLRLPVSRERVARAAELVLASARVRHATLSITFVSDARIAALNWQHLRHRGPTDVISFGFAPAHVGDALTGDVYIAPDVARSNARAHGAPVREELLRLVVHGVLHVLGEDHPDGESRYASPMWRRQERLLRRTMAVA